MSNQIADALVTLQRELLKGPVSALNSAEEIMRDFKSAVLSRIPKLEHTRRRYYGRGLDLVTIEQAVRASNSGRMRLITDLAREQAETDGHMSALLQKRFSRIKALGWEVVAAEGRHVDDGLSSELARCVEDCLSNVDVPTLIEDISWGVFDGRAASEIHWDYRGGEWSPKSIGWIHPNRLSFGPQRELRITDEWEVGEFLPVGLELNLLRHKFVQFRPRMFSDYAEREGLHRRAMYWSMFQRFTTRERLILIELFTKPWRIGIPPVDSPSWNVDADRAAFDALASLGGNDTATLPPGYTVAVQTPGQGTSVPHKEQIEDSRLVLSKLILGNTMTTDAQAAGLGSGLADAHLSEEDLVIVADGLRTEHSLSQLARAICELNMGAARCQGHFPTLRAKTQVLANRDEEQARLKAALESGIPVALSEAYEVLGFREPEEDEPVLQRVTVQSDLGASTQETRVLYPVGDEPKRPRALGPDPLDSVAGDEPPPSDPAGPDMPGGAPPTVEGAEADLADAAPPAPNRAQANADHLNELQMAQCEHGRSNRCPLCGIERGERFVEVDGEGAPVLGEDGKPRWKIHWVPIP